MGIIKRSVNDDEHAAAEWSITAEYQRNNKLLGNMSTSVRTTTVVETAEEARAVVVPPFAIVTINPFNCSSSLLGI